MPEMILPGVYIDVRAEGLISPGRVTVGNIGMVGTASRGSVDEVIFLSSATEAREVFGAYDAFQDGSQHELSLVRSLELAYENGASTVFAVRIASGTGAKPAGYALAGTAAGTESAKLEANSPGSWGNELAINVGAADEGAFIEQEEHPGAAAVTLKRKPLSKVGRNRVRVRTAATGETKEYLIQYGTSGTPPAGTVQIDDVAGSITFPTTEIPAAGDKVIVAYEVAKDSSRRVTLRYRNAEEVFTVADGAHLATLAKDSQLVKVSEGAKPDEPPALSDPADRFELFGVGTNTPGGNGAEVSDADVKRGLELLLNEAVHIVVAAGMSNTAVADELKAHCEIASTDRMKADRIAVVGSGPGANFNSIRNHTTDSDRVIFVAPGIKMTDAISGREVTLPGAYTAAVIAGMLSALDPHISLTNRPLSVGALETRFTQPQLTQLVQARVLAIEEQRGRGIRVVKGITTSTNSAFHQITTRRIVDYAKYGVRSAASPYIGRLNNERVRGALKATITSFLQDMLTDEMVTTFEVDVFATRADEIKGVANVTIMLQPTFSIDFVKVTMFLS